MAVEVLGMPTSLLETFDTYPAGTDVKGLSPAFTAVQSSFETFALVATPGHGHSAPNGVRAVGGDPANIGHGAVDAEVTYKTTVQTGLGADPWNPTLSPPADFPASRGFWMQWKATGANLYGDEPVDGERPDFWGDVQPSGKTYVARDGQTRQEYNTWSRSDVVNGRCYARGWFGPVTPPGANAVPTSGAIYYQTRNTKFLPQPATLGISVSVGNTVITPGGGMNPASSYTENGGSIPVSAEILRRILIDGEPVTLEMNGVAGATEGFMRVTSFVIQATWTGLNDVAYARAYPHWKKSLPFAGEPPTLMDFYTQVYDDYFATYEEFLQAVRDAYGTEAAGLQALIDSGVLPGYGSTPVRPISGSAWHKWVPNPGGATDVSTGTGYGLLIPLALGNVTVERPPAAVFLYPPGLYSAPGDPGHGTTFAQPFLVPIVTTAATWEELAWEAGAPVPVGDGVYRRLGFENIGPLEDRLTRVFIEDASGVVLSEVTGVRGYDPFSWEVSYSIEGSSTLTHRQYLDDIEVVMEGEEPSILADQRGRRRIFF